MTTNNINIQQLQEQIQNTVMKLFISTIALISSFQGSVIAATSLTLPTNYKSDNIKIAQSVSILGDIIRTNRETDAKRICYDRAIKKRYPKYYLIPVPDEARAWYCVGYISD